LSYEIIRFAAKHMEWQWVRVLMRPGLLLQSSPLANRLLTKSRLQLHHSERFSPPSS